MSNIWLLSGKKWKERLIDNGIPRMKDIFMKILMILILLGIVKSIRILKMKLICLIIKRKDKTPNKSKNKAKRINGKSIE